ncbi:MAG: HAMP domain-containing sensor histidine kinase [Cyanobacteria bacterium J06642_2]
MPDSDSTLPIPSASQRGLFWAARTRILGLYALLIIALVGVSIPIFRQIIVRQVERRVTEDLAEDLEGFVEFFETWRAESTPKEEERLTEAIDSFLQGFRPEDDNFLIFVVDEEFYRSAPLVLPKLIQPRSPFLKARSQVDTFEQGILPNSDSPEGDLLYMVEPLEMDGIRRGAVFAVHTTTGELSEALESVRLFIGMSAGTVTAALLLAWLATGYVLQPLQQLARASRSIRESDLTRRVPVAGTGEMAYLSKTFNRMMDRLQEAFEIQRNFVRDASHELRTPLTIVRGHLELLDDPSPEQQESLELAIDELDRMSRLVNDLTLLARSELPNFLELAPVDIAPFTDEILAKIQMLGDRDWRLEARASGTVVADRQRLTGALFNLAENAVVHTQRGDEIALGSQIKEDIVRFWVRDTGPGIEPRERERIFQRFARGAEALKSRGSGLGLAIVKAKAEAHGGWVELSSRVGVGSKFAIAIPLEPNSKTTMPRKRSEEAFRPAP